MLHMAFHCRGSMFFAVHRSSTFMSFHSFGLVAFTFSACALYLYKVKGGYEQPRQYHYQPER